MKKTDLRPAQMKLIREMLNRPRGVAVLGMGAGKTVSALSAINARLKHDGPGGIDRAVIVAPPRVVTQVWDREHKHWDHLKHLRVKAVTGTPSARLAALNEDHDVYAVSVDVVPWLVANMPWRDLSRSMLVIDEISKFKSHKSKRGAALFEKSKQFLSVWGLTGTPRPNGYEDLWMQLRVVSGDRKVWGEWTNGRGNDTSFWRFRNVHFLPEDVNEFRWYPRNDKIPEMQAVARKWMVRGETADLGTPTFHSHDGTIRWVDFAPEQYDLYRSMVKEFVAELPKGATQSEIVHAMSAGVKSGKLSQLVQGFAYSEEGSPLTLKTNPKLDAMLEMDSELGADTAIIAYHYRAEIQMLTDLFLKAGRKVVCLTGHKQPDVVIDDWNKGKIDRLLVHPASAGHGIQLQYGGHHIIWFHPTWSVEMRDQMVKRIDRPGQKHDTYEWNIAMRGSIDALKLSRTLHKRELEAAFIQRLNLTGETK